MLIWYIHCVSENSLLKGLYLLFCIFGSACRKKALRVDNGVTYGIYDIEFISKAKKLSKSCVVRRGYTEIFWNGPLIANGFLSKILRINNK